MNEYLQLRTRARWWFLYCTIQESDIARIKASYREILFGSK